MARTFRVAAFGVIVAASSLAATSPGPNTVGPSASDSADARYCLRIEPHTGSNIETVRCWTRAEWVDQGVDVDKEWAKEGVAVIRG